MNTEQLIEQLQWFLVAFNKKHRIKLTYAHRTIEQALGNPIPIDRIYEFLKKSGYRYIEIDVALEQSSAEVVESEELSISNYITPITPSSMDGLEDIDELLGRKLEIKVNVPLKANKEAPHLLNDHLLNEYDTTKDISAMHQLVLNNMGLVNKMVSIYRNYMNHTLSEEDLRHEGIIGLMKAIERFDHMEGDNLSTYAIHWIRQTIVRAIIDKGSTVRIPVHMVELIRKVKRAEAQLVNILDEDRIPIEAVCEECGISIKKYYQIKMVEHRYLTLTSLNQHIAAGDTEVDTEILDFVPNDRLEVFASLPIEYRDPYERLEQSVLNDNLYLLLDKLKDQQKKVLIYRFGLDNDGEARTLEEVGKIMGLTRERIRQIEGKALNKLRSMKSRNKYIWIAEGVS